MLLISVIFSLAQKPLCALLKLNTTLLFLHQACVWDSHFLGFRNVPFGSLVSLARSQNCSNSVRMRCLSSRPSWGHTNTYRPSTMASFASFDGLFFIGLWFSFFIFFISSLWVLLIIAIITHSIILMFL